jgi:hypothetical protein
MQKSITKLQFAKLFLDKHRDRFTDDIISLKELVANLTELKSKYLTKFFSDLSIQVTTPTIRIGKINFGKFVIVQSFEYDEFDEELKCTGGKLKGKNEENAIHPHIQKDYWEDDEEYAYICMGELDGPLHESYKDADLSHFFSLLIDMLINTKEGEDLWAGCYDEYFKMQYCEYCGDRLGKHNKSGLCKGCK